MVKIITDSVCDLHHEYIEKYDISVLPLKILFNNTVFTDGVDIDSRYMFDRLKETGEFPKTSQVTPGEFITEFERALGEFDEIICITMSSVLSGTYNSAQAAKKQLSDKNIHVVDSKGVTLGMGLMVIEAARMAQGKHTAQEILDKVDYMKENIEYLLILDTLEYLYKGGRISKTQYLISNLLNIKVILTVKNGELIAKDKVRGRKKAVKYISDYLAKNDYDLNDKTIGINHANDPEYMAELEDSILSRYKPREIIRSEVGCTVAAYSGLSAIAIYFIKEGSNGN